MYKNCVTEQSIRRQRALEAGLLDAMLNGGYESISISELCDGLEIPRKSFYRYFNGKEGALYALIDHNIEELVEDLESEDDTQLTMENFFTGWLERRRFLDAIVRNELVDIFVWRCLKKAMENDMVSEKLMSLHAGLRREYVVMFIVSGLISLVFQWHKDGFAESPREMGSISMHLMPRPIFSVMLPK